MRPFPAGFEAETTATFVCDTAITVQLNFIGQPHPEETGRLKIFSSSQSDHRTQTSTE